MREAEATAAAPVPRVSRAGSAARLGWPAALARDPRLQGAAALLLYLSVSFAVWGTALGWRLGGAYLRGLRTWSDTRLYTWMLEWWPHALAAGWNPLHPSVLWAPGGVNMAWVTGIPGPSLAMEPVTAAFGPIVSENLLFLAAPALAAWAGFLVCRRLTGAVAPSLVGGYVFGFSTYEVAEMSGHLNLVLIFPAALAVYLVLRLLDGDLSNRRFVVLTALCLVGLFSVSTEVFVTLTALGVLAWLLALGVLRERRAVLRVGARVAAAYGCAALVVSPYLWAAVRSRPAPFARHLGALSSDLVSFVVPRAFEPVGGAAASSVTAGVLTRVNEDGSYLGIPLVAILLLVAIRERRRRATWLLAGLFLVVAALALGPRLYVDGRPVAGSMPWALVQRIPVLGQAVPVRLTMYLWLLAAAGLAVWVARRDRWRWLRFTLAGLAVLSLLPAAPGHDVASIPRFFSDGEYRRYLRPGEVVLTLPFELPAAPMLWQAAAGYSFRMAGGYVGQLGVPAGELQPVAEALAHLRRGRVDPAQLAAFLRGERVGAVVAAPGLVRRWGGLLADVGLHPLRVGGIVLYRVGRLDVRRPGGAGPGPRRAQAAGARPARTRKAAAATT